MIFYHTSKIYFLRFFLLLGLQIFCLTSVVDASSVSTLAAVSGIQKGAINTTIFLEVGDNISDRQTVPLVKTQSSRKKTHALGYSKWLVPLIKLLFLQALVFFSLALVVEYINIALLTRAAMWGVLTMFFFAIGLFGGDMADYQK